MDKTPSSVLPAHSERVNLAGELTAYGPGIVCLTGGGGKTTLMYALGKAFALAGCRVLLTTTTRILRPTEGQTELFQESEEPERIELPDRPCVLTAARPNTVGQNPDHLRGYSVEEVELLLRRGAADWIIVEADGSAGRPLKAPSEKEPVIPEAACAVIGVVGLSGLGRHFTDTWVFRPGPFSALSGINPGAVITPDGVARVVCHPDGLFKGTPECAGRLLFLNQADVSGGMQAGTAVAVALATVEDRPALGIYMGAAGRDGLDCWRLNERL